MTKGVVDMKEKIFSVLMQTSGAIFGESPIEEPYSYVEKGSFSGEEQPASPDPLVTYRWEKPMADDVLEIFLRRPVSVWSCSPESFSGLNTLTAEKAAVQVSGPGCISMDFGVEFAGWLEIDTPDFSGDLTLGGHCQPGTTVSVQDSGTGKIRRYLSAGAEQRTL